MTPRVTRGTLHRPECASHGPHSLAIHCDCDGPTVLVDLRERLAAAVEARRPHTPWRLNGPMRPCRCTTCDALNLAAEVIRNRP